MPSMSVQKQKTIQLIESLGLSLYDHVANGDIVYAKENKLVNNIHMVEEFSIIQGCSYQIIEKRKGISFWGLSDGKTAIVEWVTIKTPESSSVCICTLPLSWFTPLPQ
jgi:hypothetical protein